MSRNRSYTIILVLLTLVTGLSGILSNILSSTLPESWRPYLWLAWPFFSIFMLVTIGLVVWQARIELESASQAKQDKTKARALQLPPLRFESSPIVEEDFDYDVFISYSSKDRSWVRNELLPHLEDVGLRASRRLPGLPGRRSHCD